MQKRTLAAVVPFVGALALAATSYAASFETIDTNGDGDISPSEFAVAYPMATQDDFTAADANADGMVSALEHTHAVETGILPAG